MTLAYWNSGQVECGRQAALKARDLADRLGLNDEARHAAAHLEIIDLYQKAKALRDEPQENAASIAVFDEAIGLARKIESPDFEAKCLRQQSVTYFQPGEPRGLPRPEPPGPGHHPAPEQPARRGRLPQQPGVYHLKIDDYTEALAQIEAALDHRPRVRRPGQHHRQPEQPEP